MKNELYHSDTYLGEDYSDSLKHYKYVKKERKPDGSYRYYYYHKTGKDTAAIYEKVQGDPNSKYGVYSHGGGNRVGGRIDHVIKSDKLFSKTTSTTNKNYSTFTLREVGKIEQGADAVKKALNKIGNQTLSSTKSFISKGKSFLSKIWNKIYKKEASATFKTTKIEKVK